MSEEYATYVIGLGFIPCLLVIGLVNKLLQAFTGFALSDGDCITVAALLNVVLAILPIVAYISRKVKSMNS